jgi:hypothetical protein
VILAHGGSSIGYSLYTTTENTVVFAVRHNSDMVNRVSLPIKDTEKFSITARLTKEGTLSLSLGEGQVATMNSPGTLKNQPQENLCIGHDDKNPLDEEAPAEKFNGTITSITVSIE